MTLQIRYPSKTEFYLAQMCSLVQDEFPEEMSPNKSSKKTVAA